MTTSADTGKTLHTFKCAVCEGVFDKGWSDEEAKAEALALFGEVAVENMVVVCDDCFKKLRP